MSRCTRKQLVGKFEENLTISRRDWQVRDLRRQLRRQWRLGLPESKLV